MEAQPSRRGARGVAETYVREVRAFPVAARRFLAASILGGINAGVSSILLPLFLLAYGTGEAELGRLISLGSAGAALGAIAGGPIADRWGPWRALVAGTAITGTGLVAVLLPVGASALARVILPTGLVLGGLGAVVAYLAVPPYLAAITPQSTRPYLFGVAGAAYVASTALGSLLGGLMPPTIRSLAPGFDLDLTDATIYRSALAIGAACSGLGIPFLLGARPPGGMPAHASLAPSDLASRVSRTVQASIDTWRVRETRDSTIRFLATDGLIRLGGNMVVPFFSVYFIRELGASEAWYGTMRVVERTIEVVAMLGVAPVAARLGPVATIAWTQAVSVPMLLGLGFAPDLLVATAVFLVRGTLMEMTVPLRDNFMMDRLPTEARATGSGAVLLSGYALAFVGVRIGGDLNEAGLRHVAYLAAAVLYFGGAIAFARLFAGVGDKSPRRMSDDVQAPRARSSRSTGLALTENNPTNGAHGL